MVVEEYILDNNTKLKYIINYLGFLNDIEILIHKPSCSDNDYIHNGFVENDELIWECKDCGLVIPDEIKQKAYYYSLLHGKKISRIY